MRGLASALGLPVPASPDLPAAGAAAGVAAGLILLAWLAGRFAGPVLAGFWDRTPGARSEEIRKRTCAMVRYAVLALGAAVALRVQAWPPLAIWTLGIVGAAASAMLAHTVARGLGISRWLAWLLAAFTFAALLADAVGGLAPLTAALDRTGFSLGSRRITLLAVVQIAIGLLLLYAIVRLTIRLTGRLIGRSRGLDPTQQLLSQKLAAIVIIVIAFFVGIDLAGIDLTALAVFSGALGLAVGFGLQKTVGNLFAGIILLMDRSIKPGDVISVGEGFGSAGESFGSVNKIGVRAVSIVTRDGKEYLIPNELLMTQEVVNWSYSTKDVRISIPISVAYDCDVELAHKLMLEAAGASPRVLDAPRPAVWMTAFAESAIDHEIRVWIKDPEAGLGSVRSEILHRVLELFRANHIAIPNPQRDVRVKEWPSEAAPPSR
ncbi:MAG TPA: mechanosensitive ion channel domain-containing protein [Allosphingosinicella sp.]|nr:mechanosensitive ion channel domain-containing protein [Allosphingosinicella sp.]